MFHVACLCFVRRVRRERNICEKNCRGRSWELEAPGSRAANFFARFFFRVSRDVSETDTTLSLPRSKLGS